MQTIIDAVRAANPTRHYRNVNRRLGKLFEELGEVSDAYLAVSSLANAKQKTWDDVREEIADALIVAIDVTLTPLPDGRMEFVEDDLPTRFAERGFWTVYGAAGKEAGTALAHLEYIGWCDETWGHARRALGFVVELAMMSLPDEQITAAERYAALTRMVDLKLQKWALNRARQTESVTVPDDAA